MHDCGVHHYGRHHHLRHCHHVCCSCYVIHSYPPTCLQWCLLIHTAFPVYVGNEDDVHVYMYVCI